MAQLLDVNALLATIDEQKQMIKSLERELNVANRRCAVLDAQHRMTQKRRKGVEND